MKILLTGSNGFIGKNIYEKWTKKYDLYAPRRRQLNLLDQAAVDAYFQGRYFDIVIHTAKVDDAKHKVTEYETLDTNLRMFYHLERNQEHYGRMYYLGSGAEYSRDDMPPKVKEEELGRHIPQEPYGFSKYIMAREAESQKKIFDFCLFGVFGKYEAWERRFISNAICQVLEKEKLYIRQNVMFDYLYVDDLIRMLEYFLTHVPKWNRYNVCRGESIELYQLALMVEQEAKSGKPIVIEERGLKREYSGNNERLMKELGGFSFTPYEAAIHKLYCYYQQQRARSGSSFGSSFGLKEQ